MSNPTNARRPSALAMIYRMTFSLGLAYGLASMLPGWSGSQLANERPSLAGHWKFDTAQSDDARAKIENATQNTSRDRRSTGAGYPGGRRGGGPWGGGPLGGGPLGGGPVGRIPGTDIPTGGMPSGGEATSEDLQALAQAPKTLAIEQAEKQILITDDAGETRTLHPDGKKHKEQAADGRSHTLKTHWDGNRLVTETNLGRSGKLRETYELLPEEKRLSVTLQLDDPRLSEPLVIRRVYDQAAASSD